MGAWWRENEPVTQPEWFGELHDYWVKHTDNGDQVYWFNEGEHPIGEPIESPTLADIMRIVQAHVAGRRAGQP